MLPVKGAKFKWDDSCEKLFEQLKLEILTYHRYIISMKIQQFMFLLTPAPFKPATFYLALIHTQKKRKFLYTVAVDFEKRNRNRQDGNKNYHQ